jgi:hypothetical protein
MIRAAALASTIAAVALGAASCGGSSAAGGDGPATLVPAAAPFYLEAAVQPEGDRRDDALAAAGKILRTGDPAGKLRSLIDEKLAEEGHGLTWEKDFQPWVGENAGVWVSDLAADEPEAVAIVESKDTEAAKAALARFAEIGGATGPPRTHAGVEYTVDRDGDALGMVGEFVVTGDEAAFKRTAELGDGGDSLADADRYEDAIDDLDDARLGHYYLETKRLMDAAATQDPGAGAQLERFKSLLPFDELGPVAGSFQADGDGLELDTHVTGIPEGSFRDLAGVWAGGSELLAELPGDAWGAFALPRAGQVADGLFSAFAGAIGRAAVAAEVRRSTGLDLQSDVFDWIGDVGAFARGTGAAGVDGALVIRSTDDAKAATAFNKIVGLVGKHSGTPPTPIRIDGAESAFEGTAPDSREKVVLARGKGRVVAAYGREAAAEALDPATSLGDAQIFGDAQDILGDGMRPSFVLSLPDVIRLADAMGATDADFDRARPYLEALGVLTSGGEAEDDHARSRLAVTLR